VIARSLFYLCLAYIFYMAVFVIPAQPATTPYKQEAPRG
jgi:hypothetical protein